MNNVMFNSNGKRTGIVDNELSKIDIQRFKDIDLKNSVSKDMFDDLTAQLSYADNKAFVDEIYEKYLSGASGVDTNEMITNIRLRTDDNVLTVSVRGEKFINSENINIAYVESHNLTGEKGNIMRRKVLEAYKSA